MQKRGQVCLIQHNFEKDKNGSGRGLLIVIEIAANVEGCHADTVTLLFGPRRAPRLQSSLGG